MKTNIKSSNPFLYLTERNDKDVTILLLEKKTAIKLADNLNNIEGVVCE